MIGVVSVSAVFFLSAGVAFAHEGQATSTRDTMKARMEDRHNKVLERMADIRDKVKQEKAQALATRFDTLNATWTDRFMQLLDHYDALLGKMQNRATIAENAGKDVASTTLAIQLAKTAIANARAAIVAQAAKTYALDPSLISTTATSTASGQEKIMRSLRTSFQVLHAGLFKDLFALRDGAMKDARKAVQNVLQTLSVIPHVDEDNDATSTESKSNQ